MPSRIIRESLLDSDRYNRLPSDSARLLFIHLLLVADDLGNTEASTVFIRRRLMAEESSPKSIDELLSFLESEDLIRLYESGGKRYAHIPRFRQRLRHFKKGNPRPPEGIEDPEIEAQVSGKRQANDGRTTDERQANDGRPSAEVKRSEEKGREVKKEPAPVGTDDPAARPDPVPPAEKAPTAVETIFGVGLSLLTGVGWPAPKARGLLGQLRKVAGDDRAAQLVAQAAAKTPALSAPGPWLLAAAQDRTSDDDRMKLRKMGCT